MQEKTLNSMVPLWKRNKNDITKEEYDSFYRDKFFDFVEPAKVIHSSVEGVTSYTALMFIPKNQPYDYYMKDYKKGLKLYSSGVMIMENCSELLPDCFGFVKGLVDSQDLSLNISREILQHDRQLKAIARRLEKKIQNELKICDLQGIDSYRTDGFILEGGSIHVDGEGTLLSTEMCLLNPDSGRNFPDMSREEIEEKLMEYLNLDKIIWIKDGIDPAETNGHIDDVACFVRPGEVACIYTDDKDHPFYEQAQAAYKTLCEATDAKGRKLKVHKLCLTRKPCRLIGADTIDTTTDAIPREKSEISIASYMNFLITNNAIIMPQYDDENDALAVEQVQAMFPGYVIEPVRTEEVAFGGGNIHCITQQQPSVKK